MGDELSSAVDVQQTTAQSEPQLRIQPKDIARWLGAAFDFVLKHKFACLLVLVLLLQVLPNYGYLPWGGIWMRMQTQGMAHAYQLATRDVTEEMLGKIEQKVGEKLPEKNINERKALAAQEFFRRREYYWQLMQSRIDQKALEFRASFAYEQGGKMFSYPYDVDSFYFLRFARNIVEKGMRGEVVKEGKTYDALATAPLGSPIDEATLHVYSMAFLYRIFRLVDRSVPFLEAAAFLPVALAVLTIIFAFLLGYGMHGPVAGFFSALLVGIMGNGVGRTLWGNPDTDGYSLFFPLLIVMIFFIGLKASASKQLMFAALCGFLLAVFALLWPGWWFLFDVMIVVLTLNVLYKIFYDRRSATQSVMLLAVLLVSTGFFVTLFIKFEYFSSSFGNFLQYQKSITSPLRFNIWPNVYTTVGELQGVSLKEGIISLGGFFIVAAALFSFLFVALKQRDSPEGVTCFVLLLWLMGMLYASTQGLRFLLLAVAPVALGFGIFSAKLASFAENKKLSKFLFTGIVIFLLGIIMMSKQAQESYALSVNEEPYVDDALWSLLETIKASSLPDAIITSWWDLGHIFKYVAERPVTVDGGSQHRTITYWVGKILATDNEKEAVGILRMLDCGSTRAYEILENKTCDALKAVGILDKILLMDKESAEQELRMQNIDPADLIPHVKCTPPQAFVIVSADMVKKAEVWGMFGAWNFTKAMEVSLAHNTPQEKGIENLQNYFGLDKREVQETYDRINSFMDAKEYIAPKPYYDVEGARCINDTDGLLCANGLRLNISSMESVGVKTGKKYGVVYPTSDGELKVSSNASIYQLIIPFGERTENVISSSELKTSIFTRLYFYRGHGLRHFKLLAWKPSMTKGHYFAYRIDWDGSEPFILPEAYQVSK